MSLASRSRSTSARRRSSCRASSARRSSVSNSGWKIRFAALRLITRTIRDERFKNLDDAGGDRARGSGALGDRGRGELRAAGERERQLAHGAELAELV